MENRFFLQLYCLVMNIRSIFMAKQNVTLNLKCVGYDYLVCYVG